jgi:hypothetical protein
VVVTAKDVVIFFAGMLAGAWKDLRNPFAKSPMKRKRRETLERRDKDRENRRKNR